MKRIVPLALAGAIAATSAAAQQLPPGDDPAPPVIIERTDEGEAGEPVPVPDQALRARQATELAGDPEVVREVQALLHEEGYLAEAPNGSFDAATSEAVGAFQRSRAIHVTGELDYETLAALGVIAGDADQEVRAPDELREQESTEVPRPDVAPDAEMFGEPPPETVPQ